MTPRRQQGAALLLLLAVLTLGGMWYLVSGLHARSGDFTAANRAYNARVLNQAKQALLGYVAHQAAVSGENNPGAFLCPEAAANAGTGNEGIASGNCTLPAVGRLPWKTIGIEKLVDASGEPLWYVVANGWAKPSSSGNTIINSNCTDATSAMTCWTGQLTLQTINADGSMTSQANAAVALIIAPGAAMNVHSATGCTARNQTDPSTGRAAPAAGIDPLNYVECYNSATSTFSVTGPSTSFNDQAVSVTAAEVLPLIEAAIADRFQKEFAALMRNTYTTGSWPTSPVLPFAVSMANPTTSPGNKLQGGSGTIGGLLPASYAYTGQCTASGCAPTACTVSASDPRCDPAFVAWLATATVTQTAGGTIRSYSCSTSGTPTMLNCTINYSFGVSLCAAGATGVCSGSLTFNLEAAAANVGMTWKKVNVPPNAPAITGIDTTYANSPLGYQLCQPGQPATSCVTTANLVVLNSDGSATLRINARILPANSTILATLSGVVNCTIGGNFLCYSSTVSLPMAFFTDQDFLDPSNAAYNWFYRNRWPEVSYYAIAAGLAPSGARSCTTSSNCLQVNYSADAGKHRGVLIIGGRKLGSQTRPATAVSDLLEGANAAGASPFELRSATLAVNRAFNDRFAVIDKNP
jgi:hypothetical protein